MKVCVLCKQCKAPEQFYNSKQSKDGKSYRCKVCDKEVRKTSRSRSPATREGYRRRSLAKKYGMEVGDYEKMLERQGGVCAICFTDNPVGVGNAHSFKSFSFAVDHCHDSGKVRGLLCNTCNRGLGFFKDDMSLLVSAQEYLACH